MFAFSFVVFGVGSDVPGGVADILQGRSPGSGADVQGARERTQENPRDPAAWRDLATALQQDGQTMAAIDPLERYVALQPKDTSALSQLASLYLIQAGDLRNQLQDAQTRAALANPGADFALPVDSPFGKALGSNPVTDAVATQSSQQLNDLYTRTTRAYEQAKLKYAQLANLQPDDASIQLQLAEAATNANDVTSAIAAYERFLKLAPDDPSAPVVRQQLKQLRASALGAG